jgi:hypothetical protein
LVVLAVGVASTPSGAIDVGLPLLTTLRFEGSPTKLPRTKPAPVRASVSGTYATRGDTHLPALRELKLEGDEHLALDLKGEPLCSGGHYAYKGALEDACRDAVIGRGELTVEDAFPESRR